MSSGKVQSNGFFGTFRLHVILTSVDMGTLPTYTFTTGPSDHLLSSLPPASLPKTESF